ncbi:hypothetical protein ACQEVF_57975 [Nonomuraea polychroma]
MSPVPVVAPFVSASAAGLGLAVIERLGCLPVDLVRFVVYAEADI